MIPTIDDSRTRVEGAGIYWPDSFVEYFRCGWDTDEFVLLVSEDMPRGFPKSLKLVRCHGFIGLKIVGIWEEGIVETAQLYLSHDFITECETECEKRVQTEKTDRQSGERSVSGNRLLEILWIDGCRLWICAQRFSISEVPNAG